MMKRTRILSLMVVVICLICSLAQAETVNVEDVPDKVLVTKYREYEKPAGYVSPSNKSKGIWMNWENGMYTFADKDGIKVHMDIEAPNSTYAARRELLDEYYQALPENGHYYERLYAYKNGKVMYFDSYLTSAWAKASSYTVNTGKTVTWSHTGSLEGNFYDVVMAHYSLSYSRSTTSSIGTTIPADSSRYSKLGLSVEYQKAVVEYQTYLERDNVVVRNEWERGSLESPEDHYIDVVYQD